MLNLNLLSRHATDTAREMQAVLGLHCLSDNSDRVLLVRIFPSDWMEPIYTLIDLISAPPTLGSIMSFLIQY